MVKARILVVEDELTIAKDIRNQLKRIGYDVIDDVIRSGENAISKVEETLPTIVLIDIKLQGKIDGIEAAEQIRNRFKIPVIYLTAYSDENTLRRAKTTEPFGYLLKPFTPKQLQAIIEMAIYKSQMEHQLREREEALRVSEEKYRTLFELASDVFLTVLPDGKIIDANIVAVQILGYSKAEFRELSGQQIIAPEVFEKTDQEWIEQVERKGHFLLETIWVRKDGSRFPVAVSGKPLELDGEVLFQLIGRDITERVQLEERERLHQRQLIQADKMASLGLMVFGMAHEINNPNHFITLNAKLISRAWNEAMPILDKYLRGER